MNTATLILSQPTSVTFQAPEITPILTALGEAVRLISQRIDDENMYKSVTLDANFYFCAGFTSCEDEYIRFNNPVRVNVNEQEGYFYASIPETGLIVGDLDYIRMKSAVEEFLADDYCEYAFADDEELTEKAKDIKQWFLNNTTPCESADMVG